MTLKKLILHASPKAALYVLKHYHIGLSNTTPGAWASEWSIGFHKPTLKDLKELKELIKRDSVLLGEGVDATLCQQQDWTKLFKNCPTGPMEI